MKRTRVVSTKCTPGFACRAFSDTTLVCLIVNEHTTKCSPYSIKSGQWLEQVYPILWRFYLINADAMRKMHVRIHSWLVVFLLCHHELLSRASVMQFRIYIFCHIYRIVESRIVFACRVLGIYHCYLASHIVNAFDWILDIQVQINVSQCSLLGEVRTYKFSENSFRFYDI